MKKLYDQVCQECSNLITERYSTSFSMGIRLFAKELRPAIYGVYGFVRFADEIVDTFHDYNKEELFYRFRREAKIALEEKISLNPVLHTFQKTVHRYEIPYEYIDAFLSSMEMDLNNSKYNPDLYEKYIYGSAEVIGLMCLKIFVDDKSEFEKLAPFAQSLGSAFQKINFLRDIKSDYEDRNRVYFPGVDYQNFSNMEKIKIEEDIEVDFQKGYEGIKLLPSNCRNGVLLAFKYYFALFNDIKSETSEKISSKRVRISDFRKFLILVKLYIFRMG